MPLLSCVLLVDDAPTTNFLNQLLLKNMAVAIRCLVAENGAQALALLDSACATPGPVLVLLDVNMPVLGGIAFLEAYQQLLAAQRAAVVVVLTTTPHPHDLARLQALPIAGLVSKPLTRPKIAELLALHF
ncbi:response regulator [Hymenobacter nivis]|uniref:Response regulator n=1 Tax=Hymenobacter nivis TaxID=1850093 RepID=A0A2Z3GIF7_9BACT|nr:response regulator [Hymenobacter nivis]AWM31662.1 response regulator [Hymenobacter nivis]